MKKLRPLALLAALSCTGCTAISLEHYTLDQIRSGGDYRTNEVLNCLAVVAADHTAMPSFALISDGVTHVQDTVTLSSTTLWARAVGSFSMATLAGTAARSPQGYWDFDPVVDHPRLEALRCACQWVLYGRDSLGPDCARILLSPEQDPTSEPHFGVYDDLARLPRGWLHVGRLKEVPAGACLQAHCCDTWVWVMPEGMEGLAQFTLVLHDIATLDLPSIYAAPPLVRLTIDRVTKLSDASDPSKKWAISTQATRAVKPEYIGEINEKIQEAMNSKNGGKVDLTWADWMRYTVPYHGLRTNVNPAGSLAAPPVGQEVPATTRGLPIVPPRGPEPGFPLIIPPPVPIPGPQIPRLQE